MLVVLVVVLLVALVLGWYSPAEALLDAMIEEEGDDEEDTAVIVTVNAFDIPQHE